jgi:hypothetical protein
MTSALVGGEWLASRFGRFTPGESAPGTHWTGGWVGPRTGLDDVEKRKFLTLPGLELLPLSRLPHSQSLYRLHCPGSIVVKSPPQNTTDVVEQHIEIFFRKFAYWKYDVLSNTFFGQSVT